MTGHDTMAAVAIGRNEGANLQACLASLKASIAGPIIYVDSGSTDGSIELARSLDVEVVELDMTSGFTAARARNAGIAALRDKDAPPDFVQFIDGDCELRAGWIEAALDVLTSRPDVAVVCGRRRERNPDASIYNRLIDAEWNRPAGETRSCGGDALMRYGPVVDVGGYRSDMIAGEEPELCVRLRANGWKVWRLDQEMTWHDARLTRFAQWWTRARRAGHAYAEGASLHGAPPEFHNVRQLRRALFWGAALPLLIVLASFHTAWALTLVLLWPLKTVRLMARTMDPMRAFFLTLASFPEALGALGFYLSRLRGAPRQLIEYR